MNESFFVVVNQNFGCIENLLIAPIIFGEYDRFNVVLIRLIKIHDVFYPRSLEFINALVIITYRETVGLIPIVGEQFQNFILRTIGILEFIHQKIEIALLVTA